VVSNKPAAAASTSAPTGPFTNTNRFKVTPKAVPQFEAAWREREAAMRSFSGFQGFSLEKSGAGSGSSGGGGGDEYVARQTWASIPEWEAWNLSEPCRRSHLPLGIWQRVPLKGEGFPEDFVPFVDYSEPVNAKYP
jgi:heme-degrading monooxygenase HmoA